MFVAKPYEPKYDKEIRHLFTLPVAGDIQIALERQPLYAHGAKIQDESPAIYVFLTKSGEIAGLYNLGSRKVRYYGKWNKIRYLSDIRIKPEFQKTRLLYNMIRHAYSEGLIQDKIMVEGVAFKSNKDIHAMIEKAEQGHSLLPRITIQEDYISTLFSSATNFKPSLEKNVTYRSCNTDDLSVLNDFYLQHLDQYRCYPFLDFSQLNSVFYRGISIENIKIIFDHKEILGMCILWDQSSFKQTVIKGYSRRMAAMRKPFNYISRLFKGIQLPKVGHKLDYVNLSYVLIKDLNPDYFQVLLHHTSNECLKMNRKHMVCGLAESDPLLEVFRKKVFLHQTTGTYYHLFAPHSKPSREKPYYFDIARI